MSDELKNVWLIGQHFLQIAQERLFETSNINVAFKHYSPEAMSHFLGRIENISFLVLPTFQQIPPSPLSDVTQKRQEKRKKQSISLIPTKLLLQMAIFELTCISGLWQNWKFCISFSEHCSSSIQLTFHSSPPSLLPLPSSS